jgi:hypothetical protein
MRKNKSFDTENDGAACWNAEKTFVNAWKQHKLHTFFDNHDMAEGFLSVSK